MHACIHTYIHAYIHTLLTLKHNLDARESKKNKRKLLYIGTVSWSKRIWIDDLIEFLKNLAKVTLHRIL